MVIDFWTYSCINCLRTLPYVRAWYEKYRDQGLVVIGVHAPEFAFEKDIDNVQRAVKDLRVDYPGRDRQRLCDLARVRQPSTGPRITSSMRKGRIRHHHFGEGEYAESERVIQQLLAEAGAAVPTDLVAPNAEGAAMPSDQLAVLSPETYVGS